MQGLLRCNEARSAVGTSFVSFDEGRGAYSLGVCHEIRVPSKCEEAHVTNIPHGLRLTVRAPVEAALMGKLEMTDITTKEFPRTSIFQGLVRNAVTGTFQRDSDFVTHTHRSLE